MNEWMKMYFKAKDYYLEHGDLLIEEEGELKDFIDKQRNYYLHKKLGKTKYDMLSKIGMVWNRKDYVWECYYKICEDYYKHFGNIDVKSDFFYKDYNMGRWLSTQRRSLKTGSLSEERIVRLNRLRMIWDKKFLKKTINLYNQKEFKEELVRRFYNYLDEFDDDITTLQEVRFIGSLFITEVDNPKVLRKG